MPWSKKKPGTGIVHTEASLYDYAIAALGRRMRSVAEIKRLMRLRLAGQPDADVLMEAVVERLKEQRYLNDATYAGAFASLRKENNRFGRQRVASELKQRGVHADVIEKAVASTYAGVNDEQLARSFLMRKRLNKPATQKDAARIFRALARAGFASQIIFRILKKWEVDDEVLVALESEVDPETQSS
jgi:regulatory protein